MALAAALRQNGKLRCLDLDIPPNDPDFARLSQEILQCCVRNTESAQDEAEAGAGVGAGPAEGEGAARRGKKVAAPILKSAVALAFQRQQELAAQAAAGREARAQELDARRARVGLGREQEGQILAAAGECAALLGELVEGAEKGEGAGDGEVVRDALVAAQLAEAQLAEAVAAGARGEEGEPSQAAVLADRLASLLDRAKAAFNEDGSARPPLPALPTDAANFALGSEDDASDAERAPPAVDGAETAVDSASDDEGAAGAADAPLSPVGTQSRKFTEEEGEVFRKGGVVLGDVGGEEGLGGEGLEEVSGEALRREILETPVERSPRQSFSDQVGEEVGVEVEV